MKVKKLNFWLHLPNSFCHRLLYFANLARTLIASIDATRAFKLRAPLTVMDGARVNDVFVVAGAAKTIPIPVSCYTA